MMENTTMQRIVHKEEKGLRIDGESTLTAWVPGVIPALLKIGFSLERAKQIAEAIGAKVEVSTVKNLVVTVGKQLAGDVLIDADSVGLTYHAIGTGTNTPAVGDTTLQTESNRLTITDRTRAGAVITLSTFYTAAQSTYNIKEAGVFGGSTASGTPDSGEMFSRYLQTYDNSGGGSDLTFDYVLTVG